MTAIGVSQLEEESVSLRYTKPNFMKVVTTQDYLAKTEHGICTAALVHRLDSPDSIGMDKFLFLPLELRRMIYRYYFHNPFESWQSKYRLVEGSKPCDVYCLKKCNTQILRVNHLVHKEAIEVLYSDAIWHFSFNSFSRQTAYKDIDDGFLQAFSSRPEFRFIKNVTIGIMFLAVMERSIRRMENRDRLSVNAKLLSKICTTLLQAPNLRALTVLWHDRINQGNWSVKQMCLKELARLPEKVRCNILFGRESMAVHSPEFFVKGRQYLSVREQAAKAQLQRYLNTVRREYQANLQSTSPEGLENTLAQDAVEQPLV